MAEMPIISPQNVPEVRLGGYFTREQSAIAGLGLAFSGWWRGNNNFLKCGGVSCSIFEED